MFLSIDLVLENNLYADSDKECDMASTEISSVGKVVIVKISTLFWKCNVPPFSLHNCCIYIAS